MTTDGRLVVADIWLSESVTDDALFTAVAESLGHSGMTVISEIRHDFNPQGMTAVWILGESHCAVHSYPEHRFLAVDVFTCGDSGSPTEMVSALLHGLPVSRSLVDSHQRGIPVRDVPTPLERD
tara:strand:+ start:8413 stop:8784 length:372 start_codon:yes stop_codon:yes gene_type:complete